MGSMDVYLNVKFDVNQEKLKKIKNKAVVRYCETKGKDQSVARHCETCQG